TEAIAELARHRALERPRDSRAIYSSGGEDIVEMTEGANAVLWPPGIAARERAQIAGHRIAVIGAVIRRVRPARRKHGSRALAAAGDRLRERNISRHRMAYRRAGKAGERFAAGDSRRFHW